MLLVAVWSMVKYPFGPLLFLLIARLHWVYMRCRTVAEKTQTAGLFPIRQ